MRASVDNDRCIECGLCVELCPAVFELGNDGKARVKVDPVPPEHEAACRDAAGQCPTEAITVHPT